jgi:uncharacterized membrane protein YjfL (UPF0719 family)
MVNLAAIAAGFLQLILGLVFAAVAVYLGVRVFDRFTKDVDEIEELHRGNLAVGVLLAAVVVTVAIIVQSGVAGLTAAVLGAGRAGGSAGDYLVAVAGGLLQLLLGIVLAVVAIFLAVAIFGKVTRGVDEMAELRKGNVAVAVVLAGFLLAVGFVIQAGVGAISAGFA